MDAVSEMWWLYRERGHDEADRGGGHDETWVIGRKDLSIYCVCVWWGEIGGGVEPAVKECRTALQSRKGWSERSFYCT